MTSSARGTFAPALLIGLLAGTLGFEAPAPRKAADAPPAAAAEDPAAGEARARLELAALESAHGPAAAETASALDDLAAAIAGHRDPSRVAEALDLVERAARIRARLLGADHPEVAAGLSRAVHELWPLERYAALAPLAERALTIRRRALGERDRLTGQSLYQMAEVLRMTGDFARARALHEAAVSVWEGGDPRDQAGVAASLYYLGFLRWSTGDLDGARALIERSLAIRERTLGPDHEQVAACLKSLGTLAILRGDAAGAGPLLERALAVWEGALGPDDPQVARALSDLGRLEMEAGEPERARACFLRAAGLRRRALGAEHPLVARSLVDLARLAEQRGDDDQAADLYREALAIEERDPRARGLDLAATTLASSTLRWRRGDPAGALDGVLRAETLAREHFLRTSRGLKESDALRYESILVRGLGAALSILGDPGELLPEADPASPAPGAGERILDAVIRSRAMVLQQRERRQAGPAAPAGRDDATAHSSPEPGLREVKSALPEDAALVAYVRHPDVRRAREEAAADAYTALVLPAKGERVAVVSLGPAPAIEALVEAWRLEVGADPRLAPGRDAERAARERGGRLREAVWDPVAPLVGTARTVFVVPDGAMGLIGLSSLPVAGGRYLVETAPVLHYLTAERDLLASSPAAARGGDPRVLVIGGADFDAPLRSPAGSSAGIAPGRACPVLESPAFPPLLGARAEAAEVESLWRRGGKVDVLTGAEATESRFRTLAPGRRILHVATHGFVRPDRCRQPAGPWVDVDDALAGAGEDRLRSGLALAGANRAGEARGDGDDGVLTAEEIAAMDLSGVEWAVLSACDTGLGEVTSGEGVLGLRRAFRAAGARTVITSLWAVDDGASRVWMRRLYEERLAGRTTAEAARRASLAILETQRRRGATTHPFFWGGFLAAGDWR